MGKMKENPRYNVVSLRMTDEELEKLESVRGKQPRAELLLRLFNDYVERLHSYADPS